MRFFLSVLAAATLTISVARSGDLRNFDDAPLHAVQFIDLKEGWAVGDEGVVWHTIDAGFHWERQPTGQRGSLRSLHFINSFTGWVAGREDMPYGRGSRGILLVTSDGGLRWHRLAIESLPGLQHIHFVDEKKGYAVGDGSDRFPGGVFATTDGGRKWTAVHGPAGASWLAADFANPQNGVLAGCWSRLWAFQSGSLKPADVDLPGSRNIRAVKIVGKGAVAAGQGGLLLVCDSLSENTWHYANLPLPTEVRSSWDFHSVHSLGDELWAVGRPGSVFLHSKDRGKNWEVGATHQPLPLNGITFADSMNGWAVGELGSILCTKNGGKNWFVQRRGGQRSAALFVNSQPDALPLDVMALIGGQNGFLTTGVVVNATDSASQRFAQSIESLRLAAAVRQNGGAAGEILWHFPVRTDSTFADKQILLSAWNRSFADRAAEEMRRQLVLAIRIWRPDVMITEPASASQDQAAVDGKTSSAAALVAETVLEAFRGASDPTLFPEQIKVLGLEPWKSGKLYGLSETKKGSQVVVDVNQTCSLLEDSPRNFAQAGFGLLTERSVSLLPSRSFRLVDARVEGAADHRDLMQGVSLRPGGAARRREAAAAEPSVEMAQSLKARRQAQVLADSVENGLVKANLLLPQLQGSLQSMTPAQGAAATFALGKQYARLGQWNLARETFLLFLDRYPAHPLGAEAARWLVRFNTSGEARRRQELSQFISLTSRTFNDTERDDKIETSGLKIEMKGGNGYQDSGQVAVLRDRAAIKKWNKTALDLGGKLPALESDFETDPSFQFCFQAAHRALGEFDAANRWYTQYLQARPEGPFRAAAAAELWLENRRGPCPKPFVLCRQVTSRPHLDGKLNDACWEELSPVPLSNNVGDLEGYSAEVRLGYDQQFLYVAVQCRHPEGRAVPPAKTRGKDEDLRPYDRVQVLLDLDRDYATYYRLEIDQRGCVCDDCWGDKSWNPHWFVAVRSEPTQWQAEAAIPWNELTGDPVTLGQVLCCNLVRVIPGRGIQALSVPAEADPPRPEGMGLMQFAQTMKGTGEKKERAQEATRESQRSKP